MHVSFFRDFRGGFSCLLLPLLQRGRGVRSRKGHEAEYCVPDIPYVLLLKVTVHNA